MEHLYFQNEQIKAKFETEKSLFSPHSVDKGTLAMLSKVQVYENEKILDLGCGYGFVGIYLNLLYEQQIKQVICSDIDKKAVQATKHNIGLNNVNRISTVVSEGFKKIEENDFTLILSNPPYHTDFSVAKHFIEQAFHHLVLGGKMYMVTKRKLWYKKKLIAIFGEVRIHEIDYYYIFVSEKRDWSFKNRKK
jgi:16S rRNA (guanine1207-N2)-methyltransferase